MNKATGRKSIKSPICVENLGSPNSVENVNEKNIIASLNMRTVRKNNTPFSNPLMRGVFAIVRNSAV